MANFSTTAQLFQLVSDMARDQQLLLLKQLIGDDVGKHIYKLILDMTEEQQIALSEQLEQMPKTDLPENMVNLEGTESSMREDLRKPCLIGTNFRIQDRRFKSYILDVSVGGVFIEAKEQFPKGTDILLKFSIPNRSQPFTFGGKIAWSGPAGFRCQIRSDHCAKGRNIKIVYRTKRLDVVSKRSDHDRKSASSGLDRDLKPLPEAAGGKMKSLIPALVLAFGITVWGLGALKAEVYTWTDENGVKHFSDQPPAEAKGAKPAFPAYNYDEAADKKRTESDTRELQQVIKTIDKNYEEAQQEEKQRQQEAQANQPPTMEEMVAAERDKLELKIAELEAAPLEFFGSQRNKRLTIGYYRYRLEDLAKDPEKYFNEPTQFEGNIKASPDEHEKQP